MLKRDIVFRGKRVDNGQWVEGFYSNLYYEEKCEEQSIITYQKFYAADMSYPYPSVNTVDAEVDPETVGQFTGRYDKNDKEIFERDIVVNKNIHGKKWIVEYRTDSEYVGFVLKEIGTNGISLFTSWNDIEVIGNIHDNKELLK